MTYFRLFSFLTYAFNATNFLPSTDILVRVLQENRTYIFREIYYSNWLT